MSVEAYVLAGLVKEGTPRKAFQAGVTADDFGVYDEEWRWICERADNRLPINQRVFTKAFPDFEFVRPDERLQDLIEELKQEASFISLSSAIEEVQGSLAPENVMEWAEFLGEKSRDILRQYAPQSDVNFTKDYMAHLAEQKALRTLHANGQTFGIPSGFKNIDHHWGGLIPGRMIVVLGRPGNAKSMLLAKFFVEAFIDGRNVGMFSPEMNEREHRCRVATLLSADKRIQEIVGLKKAFRNRALMEGHGYNEKTYKRFWQALESEFPGNMHLFTRKWRRNKMTPGFIEARIDDLGIEEIIVDPIYKLKPPQKRALKWEELQDTVDAVQDLAESFNIPVIISNQANRAVGNKGDAPHMDASFGGDSPVQEADHVIGCAHFSEERKLVLRCTKNRFGGDFRVDIRFHPNIGIMEDITPLRGNYFKDSEQTSKEEVEEMIREVDND